MAPSSAALSVAEIESALLGVLLTAENTRDGVAGLLRELAPVLDDLPAALAVRDRDGLTLHVLAETGTPQRWPGKLEPQFAISSNPGVDATTDAYVTPLRAHGRVVGALLSGDAPRAAVLLTSDEAQSLLATSAAVLHVLVARTDAELRRRAYAARSIETIIDGMAHQMANPLTGASALAQLLLEELQDESQRQTVLQIRQELGRAFAVLSDLLEFQRDTRAQDGILDLGALVERTLRFRGYAIREQGIALEVELPTGYLPVRADARGLEHALLVALRHAELQSHSTVNRRIAVRLTERPNAELALQITDSGTGAVPDVEPNYLDLPYRTEHPPATRDTEAADLGLVDSLLRGSGGRLELRGSKTDGTTLMLVLPKAYTSVNSRKTA